MSKYILKIDKKIEYYERVGNRFIYSLDGKKTYSKPVNAKKLLGLMRLWDNTEHNTEINDEMAD